MEDLTLLLPEGTFTLSSDNDAFFKDYDIVAEEIALVLSSQNKPFIKLIKYLQEQIKSNPNLPLHYLSLVVSELNRYVALPLTDESEFPSSWYPDNPDSLDKSVVLPMLIYIYYSEHFATYFWKCCLGDHPYTPLSMIRLLALEDDPEVQASVAYNPNTPHDILLMFAELDSSLVMSNLSFNAQLTLDVMNKAFENETFRNRLRQRQNEKQDLPIEIVERLANFVEAREWPEIWV